MEDGNTIETVEKHVTNEEEKDELEKAMKIFGLGEEENGRKKEND